ncbi:hypothetical protein TNCV_4428601 [Trichonephila clavipes]|nr:hypothetical protein TNCV_4428601 [Trichonephila clavipes]
MSSLGVFMTTPSDANYQRVIRAGVIASCFTCELRAIIDPYETLPVLEQANDIVIFCNSKAALRVILNGGSRITEEICSRLFRLQDSLFLLLFTSTNLYVDNIEQIDRTVVWAHGTIRCSPFLDTTSSSSQCPPVGGGAWRGGASSDGILNT